ncbi:hypothetical protein BDZ97DRAFT_753268 [Flammula alnicola]|nr:hypothetical protein BDZ97DRAFT_753268 [Flammula alnicola]
MNLRYVLLLLRLLRWSCSLFHTANCRRPPLLSPTAPFSSSAPFSFPPLLPSTAVCLRDGRPIVRPLLPSFDHRSTAASFDHRYHRRSTCLTVRWAEAIVRAHETR